MKTKLVQIPRHKELSYQICLHNVVLELQALYIGLYNTYMYIDT